MDLIQNYLFIEYTRDRLTAELHCTDKYNDMEIELNERLILDFFKKNKIVHGIIRENYRLLLDKEKSIKFPLRIAEGTPPLHGEDGKIHYTIDIDTNSNKQEDWNFRDVMQIPSVTKNQKLATITLPSEGEPGKDIFGHLLPQKRGKPVRIRAGKNVVFNEQDLSFYAEADGQISVANGYIHVHNVYEVNETLSMKIGNIDFIGSVIIHGDVPSGYTVKAEGDIKIFGMVEAATIISGGSVMISEGLAGMKTGYIEAAEDIHIGYINQGIVECGNDLYVENSILHSECAAKNQVICQRGNIIGGSILARKAIKAKDIGNRMNTRTEIYIGAHKFSTEKEEKLLEKRQKLQETAVKLATVGKKLMGHKQKIDPQQLKLALLRQRNSLEKTKKQLFIVNKELEELGNHFGNMDEIELIVRDYLYANCVIAFGKYKRNIHTNYRHVKITWKDNEFNVQPL